MALSKFWTLMTLIMAGSTVHGFVTPSFGVGQRSVTISKMVASNLEDPDDLVLRNKNDQEDALKRMLDWMDNKMQHVATANNPAEAFGQPINKELKGFNAAMVNLIKSVIFDTLFSGEGRDMARFYALETIARMPYFSYLFVLHFYETLGWWRQAGYLKIHFAESWNEHHHLLIMEELGGSERWADRFVAQHVAIGYFWMVVGMYFANPTLAYNLNQNVEEHAFATYDSFLKANKEELKKRPAPRAAINYYRNGDLYMMDAFQTNCAEQKRRRPEIENLYDVFVAIRDDEMEHVKTMAGLQEGMALQSISDDDTCEVPPDVVITAKVTP